MKIRALLAGFFLVASATSAFAAGPYIGAGGGVNLVHDSDIEITGIGEATLEFDPGFGLSVSAGYDFEPMRLEFEFGYRNAEADEVTGPGGSVEISDTELTIMSYMVNIFFDMKTQSPFTPYIGAGAGMLNGELEVEDADGDEDEFGYQVIAGAAYNINKNLAIDLSYRFQHAPNDFSVDDVEIEHMSSNVMAGLRWTF